MRVLLHTCCAPCATVPIRALQSDSHRIVAYFHNPNIHPVTEFASRLASVLKLTEEWGIDRIIDSEYGLPRFLDCALDIREGETPAEPRLILHDRDGYATAQQELRAPGPDRCARCYAMRLSTTAQVAAAQGFDAFSTTLLVSPYQKHELIVQAGEEAAHAHGIAFHHVDYRGSFPKTREIAIEVGLYRQKYCGCIFSEAERYAGQIDRLVHKSVLSAE